MVRISAIFIAACMVLIAGSAAAVLYLRFGFSAVEAAVVALGVLVALAVYNAVAARQRDRAEVSDQIATISRSSGDLARQLAEFGRRLGAMESRLETVLERSLATAQPLAAELEELSRLVKDLADSVAAHDAVLAKADAGTGMPAAASSAAAAARASDTEPLAVLPPAAADAAAVPAPAPASTEHAPPPQQPPAATAVAAFGGLDRDRIVAMLRDAIEANRIDLYLQPVVTLPQRKVRYYEAMSRLKADNGDIVAAADFLKFAEGGALMPALDRLTVLRCVQVVRRLLLKNRDIGLFCNLSAATLTDAGFPELLEFIEANRAIAPSLVFEFTQSAVRAMGPIEQESLAALAERGFRFSMDNLADLRVEPRELTERGFRFIKAPAALLLNRAGAASTDIHPADFSDLLGRFGIDLVADRIEGESTVVDLLDYDVRFGQGFLFAPPRPVRAEALRPVEAPASAAPAKASAAAAPAKSEAAAEPRRTGAAAVPGVPDAAAAASAETVAARGLLAQLVRATGGRG